MAKNVVFNNKNVIFNGKNIIVGEITPRAEYLIGSSGNDTVQLSYNNDHSYDASWSKYIFKVNNITSFDASNYSTIYFDAIMNWWAYKNPDDRNLRVHAMGLFGLKSNNSTSDINVYSQTALDNKVLGNAWLTGWQWAGKRGNEWSWDNEINNGGQEASTKVRQTFSLDISSLTGTQYLYYGGSVNGGGITNPVSVYNIWLE